MKKKVFFSFFFSMCFLSYTAIILIIIDFPKTRAFHRIPDTPRWGMPFWSFEPNKVIKSPVLSGDHFIFTDENGYRVESHGYQLPKNTRIGVVGASNGFGYMLSYETSLVGNLEQHLKEPIANASNLGYDTCQVLHCLKKILPKFPALEVVLIYASSNDAQHLPHNVNAKKLVLWAHRSTLISVSYGNIFIKQPILRYYIRTQPYSPRVPVDKMVDNLDKMEKLCQANGIVPVFITDPLPFHQKYKDEKWIDVLEKIKHDPLYLRVRSYDEKMTNLQKLQDRYDVEPRYLTGADPEKIEYVAKYEPIILSKPYCIDVNKILKETLAREGLEPENVFLKYPLRGKFYADHCHLNELGWSLISEEIAEAIRPHLRNPEDQL